MSAWKTGRSDMYDDTPFYMAQQQQQEDEYRAAVEQSTYEPLQEMVNVGPARLDHEGCVVDSGEYVAALYESYAADHEYAETYPLHKTGDVHIVHVAHYATAAQMVA